MQELPVKEDFMIFFFKLLKADSVGTSSWQNEIKTSGKWTGRGFTSETHTSINFPCMEANWRGLN